MRLWSLHPRYLDTKGLLALWREGLLAQKVLLGETKGYKNHPQLDRFKQCNEPIEAIGHYLMSVHTEANNRGYEFDFGKIKHRGGMRHDELTVTDGQLKYERQHLINKLIERQGYFYAPIKLEAHPIFKVVKGKVESWEKIS